MEFLVASSASVDSGCDILVHVGCGRDEDSKVVFTSTFVGGVGGEPVGVEGCGSVHLVVCGRVGVS